MTTKNIEQWLNKGLVSEDEANRLLEKVIDPQQDDDAWHYAKQAREENDWNCADANVEDVDFSEVEI